MIEHKGIQIPDWLEALAGEPDFPESLEAWEGTMEFKVAQLGLAIQPIFDELTALFEKSLHTRLLYRFVRWYSHKAYNLEEWRRVRRCRREWRREGGSE